MYNHGLETNMAGFQNAILYYIILYYVKLCHILNIGSGVSNVIGYIIL